MNCNLEVEKKELLTGINTPEAPLPPLNLFSPSPARTSTTIDLLWDKPANYSRWTGYDIEFDVFLNDTLVGSTTKGNYKVRNLKPDTRYSFHIRARRCADGALSSPSNIIAVSTKPQGDILNILDFGAVGDGAALNTQSIQTAIQACPPNGTVLIPQGVFKTGALFLKSDMTLYLSKDSKLLGSHETKDYPSIKSRYEGSERDDIYASIITAGERDTGVRLRNITLCGEGTIDAQGSVLAPRQTQERNRSTRSNTLTFINCDDVYIQGITIENSPNWTIHPIYCNNVATEGVILHTETDPHTGSRYNVDNCDGWDPDSSTNCYAYNVEFNTHDDCIAIKSGANKDGLRVGLPSKNIRITDCDLKSGGGLAIGSEMSGGVENVFVQDCVFGRNDRGIQIKTRRMRGGYIKNIVMKDIDMEYAGQFGIKINMRYYDDNLALPQKRYEDPETPVFENMHFENIVCKEARAGITMLGLPESPIRNISLKNVRIQSSTGFYGLECDTVRFENVSLEIASGPLSHFKNCTCMEGEIQGAVPAPYETLTIRNLCVRDAENRNNWSIRGDIRTGESQYGEEPDYLITELPVELAGCDWIRTANDSNTFTLEPLVTFEVQKDSEIYIAHTDTIPEKPSWMNQEWQKTGLVLKEFISEQCKETTYSLFKKHFTSGTTVSLGANGGTHKDFMYTIIVKEL